MHGILASAELLAESALDENQHSFLQTVISCGRALSETVSHVLDYSKLSSVSHTHETTMKVTKVDLQKLIEDTAEGCLISHYARPHAPSNEIGSMYSPTTPGKPSHQVEFLVDIPPREGGWTVRCEKGGIRRILQNLIANALKFTTSGYVTVGLKETTLLPDSGQLAVEVILFS